MLQRVGWVQLHFSKLFLSSEQITDMKFSGWCRVPKKSTSHISAVTKALSYDSRAHIETNSSMVCQAVEFCAYYTQFHDEDIVLYCKNYQQVKALDYISYI